MVAVLEVIDESLNRATIPDITGVGYMDIEQVYREVARGLVSELGPLIRVEYLSHYPRFEIDFVYEKGTVRSGPRTGYFDISFLRLGYYGEGPRFARVFLDESGFHMSAEEIDQVRPGAVIELDGGKVVVNYPKGVHRGTCWQCGQTIADNELSRVLRPPSEGGHGVLVHSRCLEKANERIKAEEEKSQGILQRLQRWFRGK